MRNDPVNSCRYAKNLPKGKTEQLMQNSILYVDNKGFQMFRRAACIRNAVENVTAENKEKAEVLTVIFNIQTSYLQGIQPPVLEV